MMYDRTDDAFSVAGRVCVIMGAGGGLGGGIAAAFAARGAKVLLADLRREGIESLAREFVGEGFSAAAFQVDATDGRALRTLADGIMGEYGRIDILINCAGLSYLEAATEFSEEKWDLIMNVNIKATFLSCQAFGRHMLAAKWGRIVNLSSVRGLQGRAKDLAYAPSKGAVNQLTRSLAIEWAPMGVNVNAIAPTFIKTDMNRDMLGDRATHDWVLSRIPKGRLGEISDLVGPIVFLCSPGSEFVTGQVIYVDGGWTAA